MLYGNKSISYYSRNNIAIWMSLAFQAGLLNVGGFMACHRFVSHITGFATYFGWELNQSEPGRALGMLVVPLFFLLGAFISGILVDVRIKMDKAPKYYIAFGLIFFLLLIVLLGGVSGFFGAFGQPLSYGRDYALLIILCLVCGLQNGTITTVSKSVVRTTHLTGITTDLGIGLARELYQVFGVDAKSERRANLMRFGIIFFFCLGSVAGAFAFERLLYLGFLIPVMTSGALFGTMIYFNGRRGTAERESA